MRLIDADNADAVAKTLFGGQIGITFYQAVHATIDALPTIDAEPVVHAHWIYERYKGMWPCGSRRPEQKCSNCGSWSQTDGNYCSDCGARMNEPPTK